MPRRKINYLLYVETARQAACCVEEYCFNRYSAIPYSKICYFCQITKNDNIVLSFSAKYYEIVDILE